MSQPDLSPPGSVLGPARKPKTTIYIVLLIVALVALLAGCILLLLEIKRHGGFGSVRGRISAAQPTDAGRDAIIGGVEAAIA